MKLIYKSLIVLSVVLALVACSDDDGKGPTITDVAVATPNLSTLVTALQAAGLDSTLNEDGPFTVFAPDNAAFAKIPEADLNALLANTDALKDVLLYHVVSGQELGATAAVGAAEPGTTLGMANGDSTALSLSGSNLLVNTSMVTTTDVVARNGIVHIIDTVLMPPADRGTPDNNIVETAIAAGSFNTLVTALQAAGLDSVLSDETRKFTVFAPDDDAFAKLPDGTVAALLGDIPTLSNILLTHVVADAEVNSITALSLNGKQADTASGKKVNISISDGKLKVNNATVKTVDIYTNNGIIHVIDEVIMDQAMQ